MPLRSNAAHDQNRVPTLIGVSTLDGITPVAAEVDPANGQVQVSSSGGGGGGAAKATDAYGIQAISDDGTYKYFFFEDASANWYVMRKASATNVFDYTKGIGGYASVYVDATHGPSGSPTFAGYGVTF